MDFGLCPTDVSNSPIHAVYSGAGLGLSGAVLSVLQHSCGAWLEMASFILEGKV